MEFDWISKLLPLVNATGVPLLAVGFYLLFRAYQKSIDTYQGTYRHLTEENRRLNETYSNLSHENSLLKERLQSIDTEYYDQIDKMRESIIKTANAISELQARKVALLSKEDVPESTIVSDVNKINEAIALMQEFASASKEIRLSYKKHIEYFDDEMKTKDLKYNELALKISKLSEQIGDTSSRVIVVRVVSSDGAIQRIISEIEGKIRGIVTPSAPDNEKTNSSPLMLGAAEENQDVDDPFIPRVHETRIVEPNG